MHPTGLLVLSSHVSTLVKGDAVSKILKNVKKFVKSRLYVHLNNAHESFKSSPSIQRICLSEHLKAGILMKNRAGSTFSADVLPLVTKLYSEGSRHCSHIDINVLLHNIGTGESTLPHPLNDAVQCVLIDHPNSDSSNLRSFMGSNFTFPNKCDSENLFNSIPIYDVSEDNIDHNSGDENMINKSAGTVIGGTFDHMHHGHKVLLSEAILLTKTKLVIGVSDGPLLEKKTLRELIQPVEDRKSCLEDFIFSVSQPDLNLHLETITDPYGPSITVPDLEVILVSKETEKGGHMVNEKRKDAGLSQLKVHIIGQGALLDDMDPGSEDLPLQEKKASSSSTRFRLLGTLLKSGKTPQLHFLPESLPKPFVIGLTGGIAAGKSSVASRLESLGAVVIDCDKLGHKSYLAGSSAYKSIVSHFGDDIISGDGQLDRRKLGGIVFSDEMQMAKLNSIVWPEIKQLCEEEIVRIVQHSFGMPQVIVLDAAVLLEAKWDILTNEVWVVSIPKQEAISRIVNRNQIPEESAQMRVESQPSNEWRTKQANVVLSTLWDPSVTQNMVEKAWMLLQKRNPEVIPRSHKL